MKNKTKIILGSLGMLAITTLGTISVLNCTNHVTVQKNKIKELSNVIRAENKDNYNFLVKSAILNINRITNKKNLVLFTKVINDIHKRKLLLIDFVEATTIIDLKTSLTLEIKFKGLPFFCKNENLIYGGRLGILKILENNRYSTIDSKITKIYNTQDLLKNALEIRNDIKPSIILNEYQKRKNIIDGELNKSLMLPTNLTCAPFVPSNHSHIYYNRYGKFNITYQVPYSWWFASRDSWQDVGYVDTHYLGYNYTEGLCEYVALANIMLYEQLFIDSSLFTNSEFNKYFNENTNPNSIENTSPYFKQYAKSNPSKGLVYDLWKNANYSLNLTNGGWLKESLLKFLRQEDNSEAIHTWECNYKYGGYWRAWNSVTHGIPCILGSAPYSAQSPHGWPYHAYTVYGYDNPTNCFLVTMDFGQPDATSVLYSYYVGALGSYWVELHPKNNFNSPSKNLKKVFYWNGNWYTGPGINNIILKEGIAYDDAEN
ncbi:putative cysteine peptidase [Ureaplasma ceti]|uniref:Peptidase C51 domain-containing protein n=1 Tax=Ureaplasma ceti TaxID=3119530 RepID=A0ABP9U606_9BACT